MPMNIGAKHSNAANIQTILEKLLMDPIEITSNKKNKNDDCTPSSYETHNRFPLYIHVNVMGIMHVSNISKNDFDRWLEHHVFTHSFEEFRCEFIDIPFDQFIFIF